MTQLQSLGRVNVQSIIECAEKHSEKGQEIFINFSLKETGLDKRI